jgi:hypothetical protein
MEQRALNGLAKEGTDRIGGFEVEVEAGLAGADEDQSTLVQERADRIAEDGG